MRLLLIFLMATAGLAAEFSPRVVNSMAELLALKPLESKPMVEVLGYYTPGDGGGGTYVLTNSITGTNAYGGKVVALGGTKSWLMLHNGEINSRQFGILPATNNATMGQELTAWNDYCSSLNVVAKLGSGDHWILNTNALFIRSNTKLVGEVNSTIVRAYSDPSLMNPRYSPVRVEGSGIPFGGSVTILVTNVLVEDVSFRTEDPDGTNVGNVAAFISISGLTLNRLQFGKTKDAWALIVAADNVQITGTRIRNEGTIYRDGIHVMGGTNGLILNSDIYSGDDCIAFGGSGSIIDRWVASGGVLHSDYAHAIRFTQETEANTNVYSNIIVSDFVYRVAEERNGVVLFQNFSTNLSTAFTKISIKGLRGDIGYKTEATGVDHGYSIVDADDVVLEDCHVDMTVRNPFYIENCGSVALVDCSANGTWGTNLLQTIYAIDVDRLQIRGGKFKTNPTNAAVTARFENVNSVSLIGVDFENLTGNQILTTSTGVGSFQSIGSHYLCTGTAFAFAVNPTNVIINSNVIISGTPSATWQGGTPPTTAQIASNIGLEAIGTVAGTSLNVISTSGTYVSSIDSPGNVQMRLSNTNSQWWFASDNGVSANILLKIMAQPKDPSNKGLLMLAPVDSGSSPSLGLGYGSTVGNGPRWIGIGAAGTDYTAGTERVRVTHSGVRVETSGITSNPTGDAAIQVVSTTQGLRPPGMTTAERLAITPTLTGALTVYDSDFKSEFKLTGSSTNSWRAVRQLRLADQGDNSVTIDSWQSGFVVPFETTLTGNKTVTLGTSGAINGDTIRIVRTGLGSFTLDVGGLKTIPSATAAVVEVQYNGSAWTLIGYQLL